MPRPARLIGVASAWLASSACLSPTATVPYEGPNPTPLTIGIELDPAPGGVGASRDGEIRVVLDDFPDPDSVRFGPVQLRSGVGTFDIDVRVDLVERAIVIRPRTPLAPGASYDLSLDGSIRSLSGRRLGRPVSARIDAGAGFSTRAPAPTPRFSEVAPILTACAAGCHARTGEDGEALLPARGLDLTGDPTDPVYGIIRVPAVGSAGTALPRDRVAPGDPSRSVLLRKLLGGNRQEDSRDPPYPEVGVDGRRMPLGDAPLPEAQLRLIQRWIEVGAPVD